MVLSTRQGNLKTRERGGGRQRERQRQRDRERDTDRKRDRERQRQTHRHTDRQRQRHTVIFDLIYFFFKCEHLTGGAARKNYYYYIIIIVIIRPIVIKTDNKHSHFGDTWLPESCTIGCSWTGFFRGSRLFGQVKKLVLC